MLHKRQLLSIAGQKRWAQWPAARAKAKWLFERYYTGGHWLCWSAGLRVLKVLWCRGACLMASEWRLTDQSKAILAEARQQQTLPFGSAICPTNEAVHGICVCMCAPSCRLTLFSLYILQCGIITIIIAIANSHAFPNRLSEHGRKTKAKVLSNVLHTQFGRDTRNPRI